MSSGFVRLIRSDLGHDYFGKPGAEATSFPVKIVDGFADDHLPPSFAGLSEHDNYHEYCRLLGRLKTNYQVRTLLLPVIGCWERALVSGLFLRV